MLEAIWRRTHIFQSTPTFHECDVDNVSSLSTATRDTHELPKIGSKSAVNLPDASDSAVSAPRSCPYVVGFRMTAMRHEPPEPFGDDYDTAIPRRNPDREFLSQDQLCLHYSPLPGRTRPDDIKDLTVTSVVRVGADCGNQLVVVNQNLVAKIYDPMYYNPDDSGMPDVIWWADRAYSREAAAYTHLQSVPKVSALIPSFYGSWTVDIETQITLDERTTTYTRPVRMILLEHLQGCCMESRDAQGLSEYVRTVILKQCIDAEIRILHAGVHHGDFCPRNIILEGVDYETPKLQIKVIDFDISDIFDHPRYADQEYVLAKKTRERMWFPKLVNPIKRYWGHMYDFIGWCPGGYDGGENWLWENYKDDERYIPVVWDPSNPDVDPEYALYIPLEEIEMPSGTEANRSVAA